MSVASSPSAPANTPASLVWPKDGRSCVIHAKVSRPFAHSRETGVGPTPSSNTKPSRPAAIVPSSASANVDPIVGCPAIGSSSAGVKMRIRTSPVPSAGKMKVDSEKFISAAIRCIKPGAMSRGGSGKTAS